MGHNVNPSTGTAISGRVAAVGLVELTMLLAAVVFLLLMVFGLLMRSAQGGLLGLDPALFYQLMTAHGAGMVGTAGLTGATILWYFTGRHVNLLPGVFRAFLGLFLLGVVLILAAIFGGGYAGAWTFLYPLPALSGGLWRPEAAVVFLLGYTAIGVGFLLLYLEIGRRLIDRYGGIGGALGWSLAFGRGTPEQAPPPTVIAAMATLIFNTLGIVVGAAVLVASIISLLFPDFTVDALLAKNMIYFFGHVFINASIYMAVVAVYEIIPEYTGIPWKSTRLFALAWTLIILLVLAVYPHHLLQDLPMPAWALVAGQALSYFSGVPLIAVTAFSLLVYLRRAQAVRWDLASALLVVGVAGWSAGAVPAIVDAVIAVNRVMHNTLWVPGHFHTYLLLGEVAMAFGFLAWLVRRPGESLAGADGVAFWTYVVAGVGFTLMFLLSGAMSIPRRWAVHLPEWHLQAQLASAFALFVILAVTFFVLRSAARLARP